MARRDQILNHLSEIPLFSACSKNELKEVAKLTTELTLPEGRVLCTEGKSGREFFIIVDGTAKVTRKGRKVAELGPGSFFGELALLDNQPRNATVTATSEMDVVVLSRGEFGGLLNEVPSISFKLAKGLARRIHEADSKI